MLVMMLFVRAIANANLLFTGNTRLPMVAGWDGLLPAWFTTLHPRWRTPVNSIAFVAAVTFAFLLFGITGVGLQEGFQMLDTASGAFYALTYLAMFALPVLASARLGGRPPRGLVIAAVSGFLMTLLYLVLSVVPIVGVVSRWAFAARIILTLGFANLVGAALYAFATRRRAARVGVSDADAA
jgi:amino acid transporter